MNTRKPNFRAFCIAFLAVLAGIAGPVRAQEVATPTPEQIDKWVGETHFQFLPNPLQTSESNAAAVQGYFNNTPGFPLWLMIDMGGSLQVDKDHFSVNSSVKDEDGVWLLDLSCVDSVNGFFKLSFAIDSKNGESALKVATAAEGDIAMYQGKIGPYDGPKTTDFRNEKRAEKSLRTAEVLDRIVPGLNFTVKLKSELYGSKAKIIVMPKNVQAWTPRKFDADDFTVICCEKQNDIWYLRLMIGEATLISEEMYLDLAIDSWTGDVNFRIGMADKLRANWRTIVDGRVEIPNN